MRYNILQTLTEAFNLPNNNFATKLVMFKSLVAYYNHLATTLNFEPVHITTFSDVAKFTLEKLCSTIGSKIEGDFVKLSPLSPTASLECAQMANILSTKKFISKFVFTSFPYETRTNNKIEEQVRRYFQCKKCVDELLAAGGDTELNMSIEDIRDEVVATTPLLYTFMFKFCSIYSYFHLNDLPDTKIPIIHLTSELTVERSTTNMYILVLSAFIGIAYSKFPTIDSSTDKLAKLRELAEKVIVIDNLTFEQAGRMALRLAKMVSIITSACVALLDERTLPFVIVPVNMMFSSMKAGNPKSFLNIHHGISGIGPCNRTLYDLTTREFPTLGFLFKYMTNRIYRDVIPPTEENKLNEIQHAISSTFAYMLSDATIETLNIIDEIDSDNLFGDRGRMAACFRFILFINDEEILEKYLSTYIPKFIGPEICEGEEVDMEYVDIVRGEFMTALASWRAEKREEFITNSMIQYLDESDEFYGQYQARMSKLLELVGEDFDIRGLFNEVASAEDYYEEMDSSRISSFMDRLSREYYCLNVSLNPVLYDAYKDAETLRSHFRTAGDDYACKLWTEKMISDWCAKRTGIRG